MRRATAGLAWLAMTLLVAMPVQAQSEVAASAKLERIAEQEAGRAGLEMVKRSLLLGNVALRYQQLVDPRQGDKPVRQRYGDYILGCEFPRYTWNWDLEYFLNVTVARPGEEPFVANTATLMESLTILQQGPRAVADLVWPLPASPAHPQPGRLAVRLVKPANEPSWMYVRVSVEGEPDTRLAQVEVHSYPTVTSGPPERQRWVTTAKRALQMAAPVALDPAEEWGLVLYNRFVQEEGGALLVMDPDQIETADAGGVYPIAIRMRTRPVAAMTFAMGMFWDTLYTHAIEHFQAEAPAQLKRLQAVDWTVPVDLQRWEREKAEVTEVLALAGADAGDRAAQWQKLQADTDVLAAAVRQGNTDPAAYRQLIQHLSAAQELKSSLYEPALQALIKQATQ